MIGLINVQYAIYGGEVFILEVNPRSVAHHSISSASDRRAAGEVRGAVMAGEETGRLGSRPRTCPARGRQGIGVSRSDDSRESIRFLARK